MVISHVIAQWSKAFQEVAHQIAGATPIMSGIPILRRSQREALVFWETLRMKVGLSKENFMKPETAKDLLL